MLGTFPPKRGNRSRTRTRTADTARRYGAALDRHQREQLGRPLAVGVAGYAVADAITDLEWHRFGRAGEVGAVTAAVHALSVSPGRRNSSSQFITTSLEESRGRARLRKHARKPSPSSWVS